MAKKLINKKSRVSVAKKRWYTMKAPKVFDHQIFGETVAADPKLLEGRSVKVSLGSFMKMKRSGNFELKFKINEIKGNDCLTEFEAMTMPVPLVKRIVKRAKKRIDDSFVVVTKDDVKVRLKPLLLIKSTVQRGVLSDLKSKTRNYCLTYAKELTYNELINKVIIGEIMKNLKFELKNVYPVMSVEMRSFVRVKK